MISLSLLPLAAAVASPVPDEPAAPRDNPCPGTCPRAAVVAAPPVPPVPPIPARAPIDDARASRIASFGGFSLAGNAALASQYRFRGTNLSGDRVALQGGLDLDHASGFYIGVWGSQLNNRVTGYGDIEVDIYGGYSFAVIEGVTADVGVIAYIFPDAQTGGGQDFVEVTSSVTGTLGPVQAKLGVAWDPAARGFAFGGFVRDNLYVYSDISAGIPSTRLTVKAHLGYTDGARRLATNSGTFDWSLGASYPLFGPVTASLEYVDAGADLRQGPINPNSGNVVARISVDF